MPTRWQPARHIRQSNSQKLTQLEEEVIVNYVADLNRDGNAPTYVAIRDMAGKHSCWLLAMQNGSGGSGLPTLSGCTDSLSK
jgi:hypothetical protein